MFGGEGSAGVPVPQQPAVQMKDGAVMDSDAGNNKDAADAVQNLEGLETSRLRWARPALPCQWPPHHFFYFTTLRKYSS